MENEINSETEKEIKEEISPENRKKVEKQAITLLIVLALVLASFVAAYFAFKPKPYFKYNVTGYTYLHVYPVKFGNMIFYSIPLKFTIGNKVFEENIVIRNNPLWIENISYDVNESLFKMAAVGFTMEPTLNSNAVIASQEISKLTKTMGIPTTTGITRDYEGMTDNIFDCENATLMTRVIRMELGNETKVFGENNCIIVMGENYDSMIKAADKLVIEWLKLMTKNENS